MKMAGRAVSRSAKSGWSKALLSRLLLFSGSGSRMIRDGLDLGLIHGLRVARIIGCACRHHPEFGLFAAARSGPNFDSARIDVLFSLTAREVCLRVNGTLCRQVLEFLLGATLGNSVT